MLATTVWELVAQHIGTFLLGVLIGLVACSRYRIVRVPPPEDPDQWTAEDVQAYLDKRGK